MSGQTLTDRIAAAQYQLTGSDVARAVCKATTHEVMAPKKKHLDYLISATNETNVNIPQMADTLFERAMNASWVVVFKALVTTHHMCIHGNERFIQYLASRNSLFNLSNFIDKTGTHGYDMSTFIRRYARYLNEKAYAYRAMAFDFTRVKKGADGVMRTMAPEKLLKAMPALQTQVDTLLEFDVHPKDLNNGIINAAFMLLFKDLIKLFASYNDGIINLLEKYFKMKKSDCKESLEIYKKFLTRVTKISEFMKIAEQVGVDKNDIPDISYAPSSILESLETHMNSLEGKKGEGSPTKGSPTNNVSPTSTPSKTAASVPTLEPPPTEAAAAAAAAEPATDSLLDLDPLSSSGPPASTAPTSWGDLLGSEFGSLTTETLLPDPTPAVDSTSPATAVSSAPAGEGAASVAPPSTTTGPTPSSADLLGDAFGSPAAEPAPAVETGGSATASAPATDASAANGFFDSIPEPAASKSDRAPSLDLFSSDVFSPPPAALSAPVSWLDSGAARDLVGDSAGGGNSQPAAPAPATSAGGDLMGAFGGLGDMLMPAMAPQPAAAAPMAASPVKPVGGDLDSTMASLAGNLGMGTQKPGEAAGGANWQAQVAAPSWGMPMPVPSMVSPLMGSQLSFGMPGATGAAPMMFPQQPMMRPQFPAAGAAAAPMSGMTQSPRKPPPPKDPLADLNIKDFL
ncbi:clathrin coat assembly protein AP180-like [Hemibagrus wyckioides]|uniref:clathrin coat assembly protein AP180-like n=1 Tax=Hemibagrus wyckioides TaxID=337641 RepID=UPI00266CFFBD|nr:clathrin coat assembly protein AP180-like [Hemibagrus wyckioides]